MKRRHFLAGSLAACASGALAETTVPPVPTPGARRPRAKPAPSPAALLARAKLGDAQMGVAEADLPGGASVLSHDAETPLPPASTLKVVTALFALDRLGADHRFATRVLRAGDTLVLAGGADPELDTDGLAALAADSVKAAGSWTPARFVVWGGALPRLPAISAGQAAQLAYNPALSGMILNFNRVHLGWRCEAGCTLALEARADGRSPRAYSVGAGVRPGDGPWGHSLDGGREHWDIPRGDLGKSGTRWLPVRRPEAYAGDVFQTLCRDAGLALPTPEVVESLPDGDELARRDSKPLDALLRGMLEYSTNLTAEVIGLSASGAGDLRQSAQAMADWLRQTGAGDAVLADHSGLSAESRIAPAVLVRLLARPQSVAALRPLLKRDPLRDVLDAASRGDGGRGAPLVEAKTGTLNFVSNLAGYARGADGAERAFAVMIADLPRRAAAEGAELPAGVLTWTERAKRLQRDVAEVACRPASPPGPVLAEI